ncbi:unnamed protein product [Heterobilharzia americana]|nr:unnamed protein product [Heterobilharzia americana]
MMMNCCICLENTNAKYPSTMTVVTDNSLVEGSILLIETNSNLNTLEYSATKTPRITAYAIQATAIILSTGPPEKPGILLQVIGQVHNGQLEISLQTSVYTEQFLWSVKSPKAVQLGRWTNIAFSWYSIPEDESGSLDVYIDGIRKHSSTMPNSLLTMKIDPNSTAEVFIGSAYYKRMSTENSSSNQIFATGGISNLAYWENRNRISCSKPRKTQKFLLGDCETNTNLPETVTCVMMQGCKQTDGSVCMDQTLSNIIRMASQANKLTYPSDFMKILQISIKL